MITTIQDIKTTGCILDTNTRNISAIRMAELFQRMGVKNNMFFLALHQKELLGVNPFDQRLSKEIRAMINVECKVNIWYFFRECVRIPAPGGNSHFLFNRANLAQLWAFANNINSFLTMIRQAGKTTGALGIQTYTTYSQAEQSAVGMFNRNASLRAKNVRRIKELRDHLPPGMVLHGKAWTNDNQESLLYKALKNEVMTYVAQSDPKIADQHARGDSLIYTLWDEYAYILNNWMSYESAYSTSNAHQDLAIENGINAAHMITTTAGFTKTDFGAHAYAFKEQAMRFGEHLYDIPTKEELKNIVSSNSGNDYLYMEFNHRQLGKTDEWVLEKTKTLSKATADKDFFNMWIHGTGTTILPPTIMKKLLAASQEPMSVSFERGMALNWYVDTNLLSDDTVRKFPFILGSDTSDNVGSDFTTLVLLNPSDMSVVMTARCNETNLLNVAMLVFDLLIRFPRCVFIPERNRCSILIDLLIELMLEKEMCPFERIFNAFVDLKATPDFDKHDLKLGSVRKQFGFKTTGQSRDVLYSKVLNTAVEKNYMRVFDKRIMDEIAGLVIRNGRIDHAVGGNDDLLVAYLVASWFCMFAKNISMYGIRPGEVMGGNGGGGGDSQIDAETARRMRYLKEMLDNPNISSIIRPSFEHELKQLKRLHQEDSELAEAGAISIHQIHRNGQTMAELRAMDFEQEEAERFGVGDLLELFG